MNARNVTAPVSTKEAENTPSIGHNNPPEALNKEGEKMLKQQEELNERTASETHLTKMEVAEQEVISAAKELVSYARKGETVLSKLAYAASHWVVAYVEVNKIDTSVWTQATIGGLQTALRKFIRDNVKTDDERLGHTTSNGTVEAYIGDAPRLGAMCALGKHGIEYHEKGYFTVPSNVLFTHVYAPNPDDPAKTKLVQNLSTDHIKIVRADIDKLFRGRSVKNAKGEAEYVNPGFPPAPKDDSKVNNKKGRPAKKSGMVSAKTADTHTAAHAPMEMEFTKADGKAAIKVTITPDTTTTETEQAKTKEALGLPVVSLATALATLLGARLATKTLGELGERTRNALSELAIKLEAAEEAYSKMDEENEKRNNGKKTKAA